MFPEWARGHRGFFRKARACGYRPLTCHVRRAEEARASHVENLVFPFLPGPKAVGWPVMGDAFHLPPLNGHTDSGPTSCTRVGGHTDALTHMSVYALTAQADAHSHTRALLYTHTHSHG